MKFEIDKNQRGVDERSNHRIPKSPSFTSEKGNYAPIGLGN